MKLKKVKLLNFRCFEEFEISFSPKHNLHAIISENMAGKSALLAAFKLVCNTYTSGIVTDKQISVTDHRVLGANPISDIALNVMIDSVCLIKDLKNSWVESNWKKYKLKPQSEKTYVKIISGLDPRQRCKESYEQISQGQGNLPIFAFVGTNYIHESSSRPRKWRVEGKSLEGYRDCFSEKSIKTYLFEWFRKMDSLVLESKIKPIVSLAYEGVADIAIEVFKKAVSSVLPNIENIEWANDINQPLILLKSGEIRTFDMLSDGYQYLFLLVGELASRAYILNKSLGNDVLEKIGGIVLIDEFGIHLHPSLQNESLIRLEKTFPNVQFIISTHSPLALNGLKKEQVHILAIDSNNKRITYNPDKDIIGLGADQIMTKIFGLKTTFDSEYQTWSKMYGVLFNKKKNSKLSKKESLLFKNLSLKLAKFRVDPYHGVTADNTIEELVKQKLKAKPAQILRSGKAKEITEEVSAIIEELFK